jgi:hypothetical protein
MRDTRDTRTVARGVAFVAVVLLLLAPAALAQQRPAIRGEETVQQMTYQQKLQQVVNDREGCIASIVSRWEPVAHDSGRWDQNFAADLSAALMKLQPDNLLAAFEATSFAEMMNVLATGRRPQVTVDQAGEPILESADLGSSTVDLVFTPLAPCRIVDTRVAGGAISNTTRTFDADGSNFSAQGGMATSCGVPYGVSRAVAMTITVTGTVGYGWLTAWGGGTMPLSSVLNYGTEWALANTTVVPIVPGAGNDFQINSSATAHVIIDVVGFYAAPVATALVCTNVQSSFVVVPVNTWTNIDATCDAGYTATGGGYDFNEGTLGVPGIWVTSVPLTNGWRTWVDNQTSGTRQVATWVRCCRIPGR